MDHDPLDVLSLHPLSFLFFRISEIAPKHCSQGLGKPVFTRPARLVCAISKLPSGLESPCLTHKYHRNLKGETG